MPSLNTADTMKRPGVLPAALAVAELLEPLARATNPLVAPPARGPPGDWARATAKRIRLQWVWLPLVHSRVLSNGQARAHRALIRRGRPYALEATDPALRGPDRLHRGTLRARNDGVGHGEVAPSRMPGGAIHRADTVEPGGILGERVRDVVGEHLHILSGRNVQQLPVGGHPPHLKSRATETPPQITMSAV